MCHWLLTKSSFASSRYFFTISLTLHRCSNRSVFASDGAQLIILHKHSIFSFSSLSTSSTDKHSNAKLSGSVFNALWCSMSMSSVPVNNNSIQLCQYVYEVIFRRKNPYYKYLCYNSHHIRTHYPTNIPYLSSRTFLKILDFVIRFRSNQLAQ